MIEHNFKVGDKIKVPTRKTYDTHDYPLESCSLTKQLKKNPQDHCFIVRIDARHITVSTTNRDEMASCFSPEDLDHYELPVVNNYQIF